MNTIALSPVRRWRAEVAMLEGLNRALALLMRAEAISGGRASNDLCDASKVPEVADLIRAAARDYAAAHGATEALKIINAMCRVAIEAHTGEDFANPLFP